MEKTADSAILRLHSEKEWFAQMAAENTQGKLRTGPRNWADDVFYQEIIKLVSECKAAYDGMLFREALKLGFYDLQNARNEYRKAVAAGGVAMHAQVVEKFMQVQALVLAPITPHFSDYLWTTVLGNKESILVALWPTFNVEADESILKAAYYIRDLVSRVRSIEEKNAARKNKKKTGAATPLASKKMTIYVAAKVPEWQSQVVKILEECYDKVCIAYHNTGTWQIQRTRDC